MGLDMSDFLIWSCFVTTFSTILHVTILPCARSIRGRPLSNVIIIGAGAGIAVNYDFALVDLAEKTLVPSPLVGSTSISRLVSDMCVS